VRQLHLVGFTSDHGGLVFAAREGAKSGSYVVTLDADLLEQIETARRLQRGRGRGEFRSREPRTRPESALTPREMQARLRAGRSVDEVAEEAGVPVEWVDRFAAPILAERAQAIDRAGRLTLRTSRRRESDRPLRAAVVRNLADRGVHMLDTEMDAAWSAYQLAGAEWVVRLELHHEGHDLEAEWTLDMSSDALVARGRLAAELGFVDTDRHAPAAQLPPSSQMADPADGPAASEPADVTSEPAGAVTAEPASPVTAETAGVAASESAGGAASEPGGGHTGPVGTIEPTAAPVAPGHQTTIRPPRSSVRRRPEPPPAAPPVAAGDGPNGPE
jgi:hypothetical protein